MVPFCLADEIVTSTVTATCFHKDISLNILSETMENLDPELLKLHSGNILLLDFLLGKNFPLNIFKLAFLAAVLES